MINEGVSPYPLVADKAALVTPVTVSETLFGWVLQPPTTPVAWEAEAWEEARWVSLVHGIGPLLYQRLHAAPAWSFLHPTWRQWLTDQYYFNGIRMHRMRTELERILHRATAATLAVVPLKGSTALYTLYSDPALRPMADLDLLVHPEDEARFTDIVVDMGYEADEYTPRHRSFTHPSARNVVLTRGEHPDNPRGIQVHTHVGEQFWGSHYSVTEALWEGQSYNFGAAVGWLSHPLGFMQHLLVHASADVLAGKARLIRFYDIALLAAQFDDALWEALVQAGMRRREARWLYTALYFAVRYFNAPVPSHVLERLSTHTPTALRQFLEQSTLHHLSFCNPLRVSLHERLTWHRPGPERAKALFYCLFPTPDQIREYYPSVARPHQIPLAYGRHIGLMVDGFRRSLLHIPRRSWLRRENGGR